MSHAHVKTGVSASEASLPKDSGWQKLPMIAGVIGLASLGASLGLGLSGDEASQTAFYTSYLTAFMYFLSIALGGLFFTLVQFASRAGWSVAVRRLSELVAATLPAFLVLFLPVLLGIDVLYERWISPESIDMYTNPENPYFHPHGLHLVHHKHAYLNKGFFIGRAVVYLLIWAGIAVWYLKQSTAQDASGDKAYSHKMAKGSYPALMLFALTLSFAAFDWMMSLEPTWFSTMFGVYYFAGTAMAGFAILLVLSILLKRSKALKYSSGEPIVTVEHEHDLGKFTFAFTVFWSYIAFSQFMLIWYAHLPEETGWFRIRMEGGWLDISRVLIVCHFAIPFFLLMSRWVKRGRPAGLKPGGVEEPKSKMNVTMLLGAFWMLGIHFVDMHWLIKPVFYTEGPAIGLQDITTLLGVGGIFVAALGWLMSKNALIPHKDPRLEESLNFKNQ